MIRGPSAQVRGMKPIFEILSSPARPFWRHGFENAGRESPEEIAAQAVEAPTGLKKAAALLHPRKTSALHHRGLDQRAGSAPRLCELVLDRWRAGRSCSGEFCVRVEGLLSAMLCS